VTFVAGGSLPGDLTLSEAYSFVSWGSLLVALVGLGVPMLALGAVAPWLVRLSREATTRPGVAAGRVLAAGTLGSLIGTFGSTHLLLGALGSAGAVRVAGAGMLVVGLVVAVAMRSRPGVAGLVALLAAGISLLVVPVPEASVLVSVETDYQWARVEQLEHGVRLLKLNEGLDSFHSVYDPRTVLTGRYFDAFLLPVLMTPADPEGRRRILVVGLGGGTMARQIHATDPDLEVVGIEIDPVLVDLGRDWLGFDDEMAEVRLLDGRMALRLSEERWGTVLIDAYSQQIYLPHHLCTREFFDLVHQRLLPEGVVALNLGGITREDPVIAAVTATLASVFAHVEMARIPETRNWVVLGWKSSPPSLQARRVRLAATPWKTELEWMVDGSYFAPVLADAGTVLIDGRAAVESLAHRAWEQP
jgi:predicted membrane-bound spermidine synthase